MSSEAPPPLPPPPVSRLTWAALFAGLLMFALAAVKHFGPRDAQEVRASRIAELEQVAGVLEFRSVVGAPWSKQENAAQGVIAAFALIDVAWPSKPSPTGDAASPNADDAGSEPTAEELRRTRERLVDAAWARLDAAVGDRRFRFDTDDLAESGSVVSRHCVTLLAHTADCAGHEASKSTSPAPDAHSIAHVEQLEAQLRFGHAWEPLSTLQAAVRAGVRTNAVRRIRDLVARDCIDGDAALARLEPRLRTQLTGLWPKILRVECLALAATADPRDGTEESRMPDGIGALTRVELEILREEAALKRLDRYVDLYCEFLSVPVSLDSPADGLDLASQVLSASRPPWATSDPAVVRAAPELVGFLRILVVGDASTEVTRIGLAAAAHRRRTGEWPAQVADLVPILGGAEPLDPRGESYSVAIRPDGAFEIRTDWDATDGDDDSGERDEITWVLRP